MTYDRNVNLTGLYKRLSLMFISLLCSAAVLANVERAILTSNVLNKEPIDDLGELVFVGEVPITKFYFFTQVTELKDELIEHRWLRNGEPIAEVQLQIGSHNWRTYSSKRITQKMTGNWQVQVWHNGNLLHDYNFVVESAR